MTVFLESPYKYWDKYLNPDVPAFEQTEAMSFGERVHCYLLEPEKFKSLYLVKPKLNKEGKEITKASALYKEYVREAADKTVIFDSEVEILKQIADAIDRNPDAMGLLKKGIKEQTIFWRDASTDVLCKCRPDLFNDDYIVDIKTTQSIKAKEFERSIAAYGYHRQAAFYLDGVNALTGKQIKDFIFLAIEKKRPYLCRPFVLNAAHLEWGRLEYKGALTLYKECLATNDWPVLNDGLAEIGLPAWYSVNITNFIEENENGTD